MNKVVELGQYVWFANGTKSLVCGKVVHIFRLEYGPEHYVIEVETDIDPYYEVRDWFTISFTAKGPLNWLENSRKNKDEMRKIVQKALERKGK